MSKNVFDKVNSLFGEDVMKKLEKVPVEKVYDHAKTEHQIKKSMSQTNEKLQVVFGDRGINSKYLNNKTIIGNARNQINYVLAEMFPSYFDENGNALSRADFNIKNGAVSLSNDSSQKSSEDKDTRLAALTSEMVRCALAKDDPAYASKALVNFILDRKANMLMIVISAGTKGVETQLGKQKKEILSQILPAGKLPINILAGMVKVGARMFYDNQKEVQLDIYYDKASESYFVDQPEQAASLTSVSPVANILLQTKYQFVGSWHCHHIFKPLPSSTDDCSETTAHLYGRTGNISIHEVDFSLTKALLPENTMFRTYVYGNFIDFKLSEVFNYDISDK